MDLEDKGSYTQYFLSFPLEMEDALLYLERTMELIEYIPEIGKKVPVTKLYVTIGLVEFQNEDDLKSKFEQFMAALRYEMKLSRRFLIHLKEPKFYENNLTYEISFGREIVRIVMEIFKSVFKERVVDIPGQSHVTVFRKNTQDSEYRGFLLASLGKMLIKPLLIKRVNVRTLKYRCENHNDNEVGIIVNCSCQSSREIMECPIH